MMLTHEGSTSSHCTVELNVVAELLRLRLLDSEFKPITDWKEVALETLQRHPGFSNSSVWSFRVHFSRPADMPLKIEDPVCFSYETRFSRESYRQWLGEQRGSTPVILYFPHSQSNFLDCGIRINHQNGRLPIANLPLVKMRAEELTRKIMPYLSLEMPREVQADTRVGIKIRVHYFDGRPFKYPVRIYLDADSGYLARREIDATAEADVYFSALNLKCSDVVKISYGLHLEGLQKEHTLTII